MRRGGAARRLRRTLLGAVAAVALALALVVHFGDLLDRTELASVDARFAIRGEQDRPTDVVVVAIDDVTFDELDERWPFNRTHFARALDRIAPDRPKAIVYDVQFTEESDDPEADNALLEATRRAGNVVLSTTEVAEDGSTNVFGGKEGQEFARAVVANGLLPPDPGGILRHVPYEVNGLRTLSAATVEEHAGRRIDRDGLDDDGAWIDYHGPPGHIRTVSFSRVVDGKLPRGFFRDKIAVIGASAPSLQDLHPTSWRGDQMPGAEVHANAIATFARGVPLRSSAGVVDVILIVLLALVVPLAGLWLRPLRALAVAVGLAVLFVVAAQLAFDGGRIIPVTAPLLGLTVAVVGTVASQAVVAGVERAQVRDLFARFVPDSVVSQVLEKADGSDPRLGGVRLVSTVMFSDLRGFTTFAEGAEPEEVIQVLNRYLSLMSDAILDHGGTLVAYMGDGIMAVFGAPVGSDDHAERAHAAARVMLERLEEFNAWMRDAGLGDGFRMGIGLNTGRVMSGNVGSERRLEYTAVGDTTNTAARLEAMTKGTPYQLLISGSTYEALGEKPEDLEFVEEVAVRGRQATVPVWGLRS